MPEPRPYRELTPPQRRRYAALFRKHKTGKVLTEAERADLDGLLEEVVNEAWRAAPFFDPYGDWVFDPPSLDRRPGRPKGVGHQTWDRLLAALSTLDRAKRPTQEALAGAFGGSDGGNLGRIQKILKDTGYTWERFLDSYWPPGRAWSRRRPRAELERVLAVVAAVTTLPGPERPTLEDVAGATGTDVQSVEQVLANNGYALESFLDDWWPPGPLSRKRTESDRKLAVK